MKHGVFDYRSPNREKLLDYGFAEVGDNYRYATEILDGQFVLRVDVANGQVKTELTDTATGEPYTLHLVAETTGAFVGSVRAAYRGILDEIAQTCFDKDVFQGDCAHRVIDYVRETYGDELEYLWKTFPSNAVWRRNDNRKWYGVLLLLSKRKLGLDSDETVAIIDLRIDPDELPRLVDGKRYFTGYHMNKKNWFTVCLDGSVPVEEICGRIDTSYRIAEKG